MSNRRRMFQIVAAIMLMAIASALAVYLYWNDQISGTDIYNRSAYDCWLTLLDST